MKSWVKLYTEINRDPKLLTLTWPQRGIWAALLALAGEMDERDPETEAENGKLDTIAYTALRIRCEMAEFTEAIAAFTERGMISEVEGILYLPNFAKRQAVAPSHQRAAQRDRQREYRASQPCHNPVTTPSEGVTPSDTDSDSDTDPDSDPEQSVSQADGSTDFGTEWEPGSELERTALRVAKEIAPVGRYYDLASHLVDDLAERNVDERAGREIIRRALDCTQQKARAGGIHNANYWRYFRAIVENQLNGEEGNGHDTS